MNSDIQASPEDIDQQIDDQIQDISGRFPETHRLSDCIESIRLSVELFALILGRPVEKTPLGATADLTATDLKATFSIADADKVSKKLRELADYPGVTPVLTTWGLVMRLAPELVALVDTGYSHDDVSEALKDLGIDIRPLLARR